MSEHHWYWWVLGLFVAGALVYFVLRNQGRFVGEARGRLEGSWGWQSVRFHVRRHEGPIPETAMVEVQARVMVDFDEPLYLTPGEARELAGYLRAAARARLD